VLCIGITLNNRITRRDDDARRASDTSRQVASQRAGLHFSYKKYGRCDYLHSVENVTPADLNSILFFT